MNLRYYVLILILLSPFQPLFADSIQFPVKIGVIIPLSGDGASMGSAFRNGVMLAYAELSSQDKARLKISFEDDQLSPKQAVSAYQKLKASELADIVVTFASGSSNAVAPLAERDGVVMLAIATDPKIVADKKWAMNLWVTPEEECRVVLAEMKRRGYKRIARIGTLSDGVISGIKAFDEQNNGIVTVAHDQLFPTDVKEFRTYVTRLRADPNLDAVSVWLFPGQLAVFARELRQSGSKLPISGLEMFEDLNEIKAANGALEGAWYVNSDDATSEFMEKYKQKYPESSSLTASNGYDVIMLSAKATQNANSREGINLFFHNLKDFNGALGTYSATGDNRFTLPAAVKVVTGTGFKKM